MKNSLMVSDEFWRAIIQNDVTYNSRFFYGVRTTGIFCRPSCKSRLPKRENVLIFQNPEQALSAHFRPCKRCKPTQDRLPEHEWVAEIINFIGSHYNERLSLTVLADCNHGTPYHLQRTFKKVMGITPAQHIQNVRITRAKELLIHSNSTITEIASNVGLSNTPYFICLFKKKTGYIPTDFRNQYGEVKNDDNNHLLGVDEL